MSDMLIVHVSAMNTARGGDYIYRIQQPSIAMGKIDGIRVINVSATSPYLRDICLQADILILHLITEHDLLPIIEHRKQRNLVTVYEIPDNFIAFQSWVEVNAWFADPVNVSIAIQYITLCNAVQASSRGIVDRFKFLNSNMILFENQISGMGKFAKSDQGFVTIGWAGSSGHTEDLKEIVSTVKEICFMFPDVKFAFMGANRQWTDLFADIPDVQKSYTPPGSLDDYYRFLETLDIGIAVLMDTPYNNCRSDVKFLEYASRGVAPVLSATSPYLEHAVSGRNALVFEDQEQLAAILSDLVSDPHLRSTIAKNAYDYVANCRLEDMHVHKRIEFYSGLLKNRPAKDINSFPLSRVADDSKAYVIDETPAETLLRSGVSSEAKGDVAKGRELYRKAAILDKSYYLPLFWLGYSLMRHGGKEASRFFKQAIAQNPFALRSLLYSGDVSAADNDDEKALAAYENALNVSSDYAPAWERMALIHKKNGDEQRALDLLNSALEANPYYSPAALQMGHILRSLGNNQGALTALRAAADLALYDLESQYAFAQTLMEIGNLQEAAQYCMNALEINNSYAPAYALMEKILIRLGNEEGANFALQQKTRFQIQTTCDKK